MRFLTVHQPYAALLVAGLKTIERRRQPTHYRGPLVIHAGLKRLETPGDFRHLLARLPRALVEASGVCVGLVELVECRKATLADRDAMCAEPGDQAFAWVVRSPRALPEFLSLRGEQGLRPLPPEIATRIAAWQHAGLLA
jgi:hypothetical protein